eukprot:9827164-Heterocapsa_arctica.AAC.1
MAVAGRARHRQAPLCVSFFCAQLCTGLIWRWAWRAAGPRLQRRGSNCHGCGSPSARMSSFERNRVMAV